MLAAIKSQALGRALRVPVDLPRAGRGVKQPDAESLRALVRDIEIAYVSKTLGAGRTP